MGHYCVQAKKYSNNIVLCDSTICRFQRIFMWFFVKSITSQKVHSTIVPSYFGLVQKSRKIRPGTGLLSHRCVSVFLLRLRLWGNTSVYFTTKLKIIPVTILTFCLSFSDWYFINGEFKNMLDSRCLLSLKNWPRASACLQIYKSDAVLHCTVQCFVCLKPHKQL